MKSKIIMAVCLGAVATPALAAGQVGGGFASLEDCVAAGTAADSWSTWSYVCVPTSDGLWNLDWVRDSRDAPTKGKKVR